MYHRYDPGRSHNPPGWGILQRRLSCMGYARPALPGIPAFWINRNAQDFTETHPATRVPAAFRLFRRQPFRLIDDKQRFRAPNCQGEG